VSVSPRCWVIIINVSVLFIFIIITRHIVMRTIEWHPIRFIHHNIYVLHKGNITETTYLTDRMWYSGLYAYLLHHE